MFILGLASSGIVSFCSSDNTSAIELSLTIPKNLNLRINPSANNGFGESSNGEISISTDNISGYTLNVKSKNNSNDLVNLASNAKLTSITESLTLDQYKNGSNGKTYVNTWGFKPSSINSSTNANYVPAPDNVEGVTLAKTDIDNSIPATYAVAIAAKVDNATPAGNYSNTFILTATANEAHYTINYDAASLAEATNVGSFSTQTGVITGSTQQINSVTPSKDGYEFLGWCDQPLESDGTCKGSVIQPGGQLRMCKCDTDVTLYAIWEEIPVPMQNVSEWGSEVEEHEIITAIDERDGNTYKVTRLKDGKLWMIENLRLGDSKLKNHTLTKDDTDIKSATYSLPNSSTSGFIDNAAQNIYVPDTTSGNYKVEYGGYYTYMAATAGTGGNSGNAPSSICPKGWHLPTGGSGGEFETMASKYNNNSNNSMLHDTSKIPGFFLSGFYHNGSPYYQGSNSLYSSSTASSSLYVYYLSLSSSNAKPAQVGRKCDGFTIRCVSSQ